MNEHKIISTGVPKTMLGPFLFILYVNDLLICIPEDTVMYCADDTVWDFKKFEIIKKV